MTKQFGALRVLDSLDLDVSAGEKVAVIGRSGSGKTTLLRAIMTLERPDAGSIRIEGDLLAGDEKQLRGVRSKVGMVFQHFNLFPHKTAIENAMLGPIHVLGLSKDEAAERARALLDQVGLAEKANAYPRQLSGGQQQRVAIARALAMRPKILLLDEVTSALDPELVGEVLAVVRDLARDSGMTMLVVTHEMTFAADISDRVIFMDSGKVVEDDVPEVVLRHPRHERTRAFLRAILER